MDVLGIIIASGVIFLSCIAKIPYFCAAIPIGYIFNKYFPVGNLELLGDLGIIILFFNIGLELTATELNSLKKHIVNTIINNFFMISFLLIPCLYLAYTGRTSITLSVFLAISLVLSSTPISLNFLKENQQTHTELGHYSMALILSQDLIAMILLIFLTNYKKGFSQFIILKCIGNLIAFILGMFIGSTFIKKIFRYISRHDEITKLTGYNFFILLFAYISNYLGLSSELGVTSLGIVLASSSEVASIEHYLDTLKNFFMTCFFLWIGGTINLQFIMTEWKSLLISSLIIFVLKAFGIIIANVIFSNNSKNLFAKILLYSNVSEVGFIIFKKANEIGLITETLMQLFFSLIIISLIFFPVFLRLGQKLLHQDKSEKYDVLLFGSPQITVPLADNFKKNGLSYILIHRDFKQVHDLKERGLNCKKGDLNSSTFIDSLNEYKLKAIVIIISFTTDHQTFSSFIIQCLKRNISVFVISNDKQINNLCKTYGAHCIGFDDGALSNNISQLIMQKLNNAFLS